MSTQKAQVIHERSFVARRCLRSGIRQKLIVVLSVLEVCIYFEIPISKSKVNYPAKNGPMYSRHSMEGRVASGCVSSIVVVYETMSHAFYRPPPVSTTRILDLSNVPNTRNGRCRHCPQLRG